MPMMRIIGPRGALDDEGFWGVRGNTISVGNIFCANDGAPDRIVYAEAMLAAEAHLPTQAQFPTDPYSGD